MSERRSGGLVAEAGEEPVEDLLAAELALRCGVVACSRSASSSLATVPGRRVEYGYESWQLAPAEPLPQSLEWLRERCAEFASIASAAFAQTLVTRYPPGATIGWHRDASVFGPVVVGVSLRAACLHTWGELDPALCAASRCARPPLTQRLSTRRRPTDGPHLRPARPPRAQDRPAARRGGDGVRYDEAQPHGGHLRRMRPRDRLSPQPARQPASLGAARLGVVHAQAPGPRRGRGSMLQSSVPVGGGCGSGAGHAAIRGQALRGRTEGGHGAAVGGRVKRRADPAGVAHRAGAQIDGEAALADRPPGPIGRPTGYTVVRADGGLVPVEGARRAPRPASAGGRDRGCRTRTGSRGRGKRRGARRGPVRARPTRS